LARGAALFAAVLIAALVGACATGGGGATTRRGDSGVRTDAGPEAGADSGTDAGTDSGHFDASMRDSGRVDSGMRDSGSRDSGVRDSGVRDTGVVDSGRPECVTAGDCAGVVTPGVCEVAACVGGRCRLDASSAGTSCDDGDSCTSSDVCGGGGCAGTPRTDSAEPNNTRASATTLSSVSDGDSYPAGTTSNSLYPLGDEDWYRYHDSDDLFSSIYPRAGLTGLPAGTEYDLCAYFDCDSSGTTVTCTSGTSSTFEGLPGCCSSASGTSDENVRLNPNCSGTDDSGTVYVRVFRFAAAASCENYTLLYGDD